MPKSTKVKVSWRIKDNNLEQKIEGQEIDKMRLDKGDFKFLLPSMFKGRIEFIKLLSKNKDNDQWLSDAKHDRITQRMADDIKKERYFREITK